MCDLARSNDFITVSMTIWSLLFEISQETVSGHNICDCTFQQNWSLNLCCGYS